MKLGNISQTIVPVPKFFLDKDTSSIDIFKKKDKFKIKESSKRSYSYFKEKDLFSSNLDLNLNHNPRTLGSNSQWDLTNEYKYIPLYDRHNYERNSEKKHTYFPDIIDFYKIKQEKTSRNGLQNYRDYMSKTNIANFLQPDLRKEIIHNTQNLVDRVNANYDLGRWTNFDSRTTFNRIHQTSFSPLSDFIKNNSNIKKQFNQSLIDTALSLKTIGNKSKAIIERNLSQKEFEENLDKKNAENSQVNLDILLETNKTNLLRLKKNNFEPQEYSTKDQEFINNNKILTKKINITKLYSDFPSKTRMEFDIKKVLPKKKKFKANDGINLVNKKNYAFSEKEIYSCQSIMWERPAQKDAFKLSE